MRFLTGSPLLIFCTILAAACGDSSGSGSESSGGGGSDGTCTSDEDCKTGFNNFCAETDDGQCGPIVRKCVQYPPSCGEGPLHTACGCDGKPHSASSCPSAKLSVQIDTRPNACTPVAGMIACGEGFCDITKDYCVEGAMQISCMALPQTCTGASASCACLETAGMTACGCVDEPGGGIRVNGCSI